jgi:hypothetical protein
MAVATSGPRRYEWDTAARAWRATLGDHGRLDDLLSAELSRHLRMPVAVRLDIDP